MALALGNLANLAFYPVNKAILFVNAATPKTGQITLQRLRFPYAFVGIAAYHVFHQRIDSIQCSLVLALPCDILLPGSLAEFYFHYSAIASSSASVFVTVWPAFSWAMDFSSSA